MAPGSVPIEGSSAIGEEFTGFLGMKVVRNTAMVMWDATPRTTFSLAYRYGRREIVTRATEAEPTDITINENGGIFSATFRPTSKLELDGSVEAAYTDNVLTPVSPREMQHYRIHAKYRPKSWAVIAGSYNDLERHNNTNTAQADVAAGTMYYGPIAHVDYNRVASISADLAPNEHYGLNLNYSYSEVYTATNVCYTNGASATLPGSVYPMTGSVPNVYANGVCAGVTAHGGSALVDWYGRDFMDAPTNSGSVSLTFSPIDKFHSNIGYRISAVDGSQMFTDARSVNGSLNSTYQSPFVDLSYTLHKGLSFNASYNFFGYGEGGPSGPKYCSTSTSPTATPVLCSSLPYPTGLTESPSGLTAPRNFHANNVTIGMHYEF
jgi:hypothetical protein